MGEIAEHCQNNRLFITSASFCRRKEKTKPHNMDKWCRKSNKQIDYIEAPNEHRSWVTDAQTKRGGETKQNAPTQNVKIDIQYDVIRTNNQNRHNKPVRFGVNQLRGNSIQLQRDANGGEISKTNTNKSHILQN